MIVGLGDLWVDASADGLSSSPLRCPGCSGRLRPWGYARPRRIRVRASNWPTTSTRSAVFFRRFADVVGSDGPTVKAPASRARAHSMIWEE